MYLYIKCYELIVLLRVMLTQGCYAVLVFSAREANKIAFFDNVYSLPMQTLQVGIHS